MPAPASLILPHALQCKSEYALASSDTGVGAAGTWPVINRAIAYPIIVPAPVVVTRLYALNGTVVSGNIDVGIYDHAGKKIVSTGSVAQAGVSTIQFFDITDLALPAGTYYMAEAHDNTTATYRSATVGLNAAYARAVGSVYMASAFPLPATLTFTATQYYSVPMCGMEIGRIV